MAYNPVSTDSRSNSPVPQNRSTPSHNQQQSLAPPGPGSPYIEVLNRSFVSEQDPLRSAPSSSNPFRSSSDEILGQPHQRKSILKNNNSGAPGYPPRPQYQDQQQQLQYQMYNNGELNYGNQLHHPNAPFAHSRAPTTSSDSSYEGRGAGGGGSVVSSTHRSSHNLASGGDPNYNMTQSDMTLEGLAERWTAYQAWWAKQYKEQPFYRLWTRSKWILLFSVILLLAYSAAALAITVLCMIGHFENSAVVMEFHGNLVYITLSASIVGLVTALVGLVGVLRENRIWLSWYNLMLWPVFCLYVSVGYIAFRREKNHLRNHLRDEWVHSYTRSQRLLVQRNLKCCGYQDPSFFGAYDMRCFPMTILPGCQHKYNVYEKDLLNACWTVSFTLVPIQLFIIITALLCSNHVDGMLRSGRPGLKSFKEKQ
ncbi:hypothetical protein BGZ74_008304 [Mortierella antarctica]|nr:hypothetical protein BGZ74_008304 [Mortierella antarctica]